MSVPMTFSDLERRNGGVKFYRRILVSTFVPLDPERQPHLARRHLGEGRISTGSVTPGTLRPMASLDAGSCAAGRLH